MPARDPARRPGRRAGVRRRHARGERPGRGPGGGGAGRRHHRRSDPGALGRRDRALGRRAPGGPIPLPGFHPPKGERARPAAGPCGRRGVERRALRGAHRGSVALLEDLAGWRAPERRAVVARELTKMHEEIRHGTLAELADYYSEHEPRGEITIVVGAPARRLPSARPDRRGRRAGHRAAGRGLIRREVARRLTESHGLSRNDAYRLVMELP